MLKKAAVILCNKIRSQQFETTTYPPADHFLEEVDSVIPAKTRFFFEESILYGKKAHCNRGNACVLHFPTCIFTPSDLVLSFLNFVLE